MNQNNINKNITILQKTTMQYLKQYSNNNILNDNNSNDNNNTNNEDNTKFIKQIYQKITKIERKIFDIDNLQYKKVTNILKNINLTNLITIPIILDNNNIINQKVLTKYNYNMFKIYKIIIMQIENIYVNNIFNIYTKQNKKNDNKKNNNHNNNKKKLTQKQIYNMYKTYIILNYLTTNNIITNNNNNKDNNNIIKNIIQNIEIKKQLIKIIQQNNITDIMTEIIMKNIFNMKNIYKKEKITQIIKNYEKYITNLENNNMNNINNIINKEIIN